MGVYWWILCRIFSWLVEIEIPHLFSGSIASSVPVFVKPDFYEYLEVVSTALKSEKETCSESVILTVDRISILTKHPVGWKILTKCSNFAHLLMERLKLTLQLLLRHCSDM